MMARLNEGQGGGSGSHNDAAYDALKLKFLRQNREIIKSNSTQSMRINALQAESTRLLTENISLREQVLHLEVELERRNQERKRNQSTQKKLEEKMAEARLLLKELNQPCDLLRQRIALSDDSDGSPFLESRLLRNSYVPGEGLDAYMPAIEEEAQSRRSSLNAERRRSSWNFMEIESPTPQPYEPDSDNETPPPMNNVGSRSRKRRGSDLVRRATSIPEPTPEPTKETPALSVVKPPKRRFTEKDPQPSPTSSSPDLDFRFSKLSARAAEAAKIQVESERPISQENADNGDTPMAEAKLIESSPKRNTLPKGNHTRRLSGSGDIPSLAARMALGPKSTNTDPTNSPAKIAFRNEQKAPEYPEKAKTSEKLPPTTTRTYRSNSIRDKDTPPPELNPAASTATGRTARRTRPAVSYAEPNLRDKMRRDETGYVDAVIGEGKVRRTGGVRKKLSLEKEPELVMKAEGVDAPEVSKWTDRSTFKLTEEPGRMKEACKSPEEEGAPGRKPTSEDYTNLPSTVMTSRRRRNSSLVISFAGTSDSDQADLKKKIEAPQEDERFTRGGRRLILRRRSQSPDEDDARSRRSSLMTRGTLSPENENNEGERDRIGTRQLGMMA